MNQHENTCPKNLTKCPYSSAGCTYEGKDSEIKEHEKTAIVEHLQLNQAYTKTMEVQNRDIQSEMRVRYMHLILVYCTCISFTIDVPRTFSIF